MQEDHQTIRKPCSRPVVVHPSRSLDDILRHTDRAPDSETERFVASIYADRRESASPQSE
jgi:hypothetical protein